MEIIARLTAHAVVKEVKDEKKVVSFSVAINDSYKPKGAARPVKVVTYMDCSYWGNPGIAEYLTKGTLVELSGRIGFNVYNTASGEAKGSLRFHVNNVKIHGGGRNGTPKEEKLPATVVAGDLAEPLDDLPF